jgi:hypothetical protein
MGADRPSVLHRVTCTLKTVVTLGMHPQKKQGMVEPAMTSWRQVAPLLCGHSAQLPTCPSFNCQSIQHACTMML